MRLWVFAHIFVPLASNSWCSLRRSSLVLCPGSSMIFCRPSAVFYANSSFRATGSLCLPHFGSWLLWLALSLSSSSVCFLCPTTRNFPARDSEFRDSSRTCYRPAFHLPLGDFMHVRFLEHPLPKSEGTQAFLLATSKTWPPLERIPCQLSPILPPRATMSVFFTTGLCSLYLLFFLYQRDGLVKDAALLPP